MSELNPTQPLQTAKPKTKNRHKVLRKKVIKVSVTDDELERLKVVAQKKPIAKYLRESGLMNAPVRETAQAEKSCHGYDENIYYEFTRQGINLNLLARKISFFAKNNTLTQEEINQLMTSLNEIRMTGNSILQAHKIKFIDLLNEETEEENVS